MSLYFGPRYASTMEEKTKISTKNFEGI